MSAEKKPPFICWVLLMLLGLIWGGSFLGVSLALKSFSPIQIAAGRIIIGAFVLSIIMVWFEGNIPAFRFAKRRIWFHSLGMAVFTNVLPFSLLSWAQITVTSSFAGVSMTIVPLVVLPLAHAFLPDEGLTRNRIIGFLIGFAGVLFLLGIKDFLIELHSHKSFLPKVACFLAAFCYATGSIITRSCPPVSKLEFSASGLILASLLICPFLILSFDQIESVNLGALIGLIYLGILPTGVATFLLVYLIQTAGPSFLSLVNYQVPFWAVFFGTFFNGENIPSEFWVALLLIMLGLFISQRN